MPTSQKAHLAPLLPPDWNDEMLDALGAFPGGLKFVLNGWEETGGTAVRGTHMLGALAQYPDLARAFLTFNNHVATNSTLTTRDRELLILRTGWLKKCEYEYIMHTILGRRAGITDEEIDRIGTGPDAAGWSEEDADLIRAADELHRDTRISESTWERLSTRYNHRQLMDIVFLVGCYDVVAMAMRSFNIGLESTEEPLDPETRARMFGQP